jgi:hypothetical protein
MKSPSARWVWTVKRLPLPSGAALLGLCKHVGTFLRRAQQALSASGGCASGTSLERGTIPFG